MKYIVRVGDREHEVVVDADGVRAVASAPDSQTGGLRAPPPEADARPYHVDEIVGTPVRLVRLGDEVHRVVVRRGAGRGTYTLSLNGYRFDVEALDERTHAIRQLSATVAAPTGPAPLTAPMPGLVVRVTVQVGDQVQAGQGLVVMEAMKMENELRARAAGRVKAVVVAPGTAVEKGALLIELE